MFCEPGECFKLWYLVNVDVVGEVGDGRGVLGEELVDHGAVGLAVDVGHGVLQHLVKLGLLHLRRREQIALQKLHRRRSQRRVVTQQPADHLHLQGTMGNMRIHVKENTNVTLEHRS